MRAPLLPWAHQVTCLVCAAANTFFYLADPNAPLGSPWTPVLVIAAAYGLFGLLAWSQRRDWAGTAVVHSACLLAAALLLCGRGWDWYGSGTVPNYYHQVMRLGSVVGGVVQLVCLVVAGIGVLGIRVARWTGSGRRWDA